MASVKKSVASAVCAALIMTGAGGGGLEAFAATVAASRSAAVPVGLEAGAGVVNVLRFERGLLKGLGPSAPGLTGSLPSSAIPRPEAAREAGISAAVQPALVPAAAAPEARAGAVAAPVRAPESPRVDTRPDALPPAIGSLAGLAEQAPSEHGAAPGAGLESAAGRLDEAFDGKAKSRTPLVVGAGLTPEAVKEALRGRRLVVDTGPFERSPGEHLMPVKFSYDERYPDHIVGTLQKVGERDRVVSVGYPPADALLKPTGRDDAPLRLVLVYYFEHYHHHTWREVVLSIPLSESVLLGGAVGTDATVTVRYYDGKSPENKVEGKVRYRFEPAQDAKPAPFPAAVALAAPGGVEARPEAAVERAAVKPVPRTMPDIVTTGRVGGALLLATGAALLALGPGVAAGFSLMSAVGLLSLGSGSGLLGLSMVMSSEGGPYDPGAITIGSLLFIGGALTAATGIALLAGTFGLLPAAGGAAAVGALTSKGPVRLRYPRVTRKADAPFDYDALRGWALLGAAVSVGRLADEAGEDYRLYRLVVERAMAHFSRIESALRVMWNRGFYEEVLVTAHEIHGSRFWGPWRARRYLRRYLTRRVENLNSDFKKALSDPAVAEQARRELEDILDHADEPGAAKPSAQAGAFALEFSLKIKDEHRALLSEVFAANAETVVRVVKGKVGEDLKGVSLFIPYATEQSEGNVLFVVTVVRNGYLIANFRADVDKDAKSVRFSNNDD